MADIKGTALLPKGDKNGWAAIADVLLKDPLRLRAALVVFNCKRGTEDFDLSLTSGRDGSGTVLTVRIERVEVVLPQDLAAVEQIIRRALEARSGQTTLELDMEDEITDLFRAMQDPDSPVDPEEDGPAPDEGQGRAHP